ncbi:MAG: gliding motility-associated C-terminal domain-containing protein [Bacteroidales bacterium]|jgi:gliding motility-associated-like protein|nr:gliding motility-associated C-terminal domain-containing protein [Bacteroidales bacterium]
MKQGKEIGKMFKEKLYNFSETPTDGLWTQIQSNAELKKFNRLARFKSYGYVAGIVGAVAIVGAAAYFTINHFAKPEQIETLVEQTKIIENSTPVKNENNIIVVEEVEKTNQKTTTKLDTKSDLNENIIKVDKFVEEHSVAVVDDGKEDKTVDKPTHIPTKSVAETTQKPIVNSVNSLSVFREEPQQRLTRQQEPAPEKSIIPVEISNDTIICRWTGVELKVQGSTQNLWSNGATTESIYVEPSESAVYSVRATRSDGVDTNLKVFVQVVDCYQLYMPTAFTPDGDGLNDEFKPVYNGDISDFEMMVFSRNGKQVFESKNIEYGWDGKFKGAQVEEGAYFYVVRYRDADGKYRDLTGQVILYRTR